MWQRQRWNRQTSSCINLRAASNQIKFIFSVAGNNNTQYNTIHLKYDIPVPKEWMVRQADTNIIHNLGL